MPASGQIVGPSVSTVQYCDDLNDVYGSALADVLEPAKIAWNIFEPARSHSGCNSRLYRSAPSFADRPAPASSSASPNVISPICYSLSSRHAVIASAARNDLERLVLRARASSLAFKAASILAVMIVLSAALMSHHQAAE